MTSVLSYRPMSDPFAPNPSARFSNPPFTSPSSQSSASNPSPAMFAPPSMPPPPVPTGRAPQSSMPPPSRHSSHVPDEFGAQQTASSSGAVRSRPQHQSMALPVTMPVASSSTEHSASTSAARHRVRQSHNPSATMANMSPPKPEHLTDEYVLHPSVYSYKQAHPRRPMVGFGPYVLLQTLGEGEFGKVKLGVHTEYGVEVAIKLIRRGSLEDEARASKVEREIDVLKTLKHPNIVRMFDVIDTDKYIGIVLEFAGGGELFDYILANRYLRERDAQKLFAQLISGVDYLHKKHIVHRDLKLENLLLDKHRNIIITDFGFANRFDSEQDDLMATSCGSPCYAAPELVVSEGLYVGSAVDIWSCGVILYAMLSGYLPYDDDPNNPDGDNINLLYKYIMTTKLNFPDHMSDSAKHLLQIMLVPDPALRCRIEDIMAHPWLASYSELFDLSVEKQERLFQENMYRKSQIAKRELANRRQVQQQAKAAEKSAAALSRSQSSVPGSSVTAGMLDANRRAARHHSAMPGSTTVPEHLANASARMPYSIPPVQSASARTSPVVANAPVLLAGPLPSASATTPMAISSAAPPPEEKMLSMSAPMVHASPLTRPDPAASSDAIETLPMEVEISDHGASSSDAPATPEKKGSPAKSPMSANKNRHTIQVEYDGEASYERMHDVLEAKRTAAAGSGASVPAVNLPPLAREASPEKVFLQVQTMSDVEMDSASSDQGHGTHEGTLESIPQADSDEEDHPAISAPLEPSSAPSTSLAAIGQPVTPRKGKSVENQAASPSTPRARHEEPEEIKTPRPKEASQPTITPRSEGRRFDSMPVRSPSKQPADATPALPVSEELKPSGLPKPPTKRDRYRKGMSLDKFGLAKLLGNAHGSSSGVDVSKPPPSAGAAAVSLQQSQHEHRGSLVRPRPTESEAKDKSRRRKTLDLMVKRSNSVRSKHNVPAPLAPRDLNPSTEPAPTATKGQPVPPVVSPTEGAHKHPTHSTATVNAFAPKQAAEQKQHPASSSAAKKVMDWFRRKSLAKDTLVSLKTAGVAGVRSDSTSSFVQVSHSPERPMHSGNNFATVSSVSSVAATTEDASHAHVVLIDAERPSETAATAAAAEQPAKSPAATTLAPTARVPLGPAASKTNIAQPAGSTSTTDLSPSRHNAPALPARSKSIATGTETPVKAPAKIQRASPSRLDEKMRVHTGLVDQSALSSKPPKEVMHEVVRVLQEMGMDIKRENEYRLRCTRVRRRKSGATTGLGLGSVMSVGSNMSPFTLMTSASASRTDSRGLPLPQSPSSGILSGSGLKGMLLRRGSSYSSHPAHLSRSESEIGSPAMSPSGTMTSLAAHEPLYGEHSIDSGDEVKFVVELCRIKNLPGLYLLNIKRLRGNVWSFKFIYQTVLERCETLTH